MFQTEDIPIALPTSQINEHIVPPLESPAISISLGSRRQLQNFRGSYILSTVQPISASCQLLKRII